MSKLRRKKDFHQIKMQLIKTKRMKVLTSKSTIAELSYPWLSRRRLKDRRRLKTSTKMVKLLSTSILLLNYREFQVFNHFCTIKRMISSMKIWTIQEAEQQKPNHFSYKRTQKTLKKSRMRIWMDRHLTKIEKSLKRLSFTEMLKRQNHKLFLEKLKIILIKMAPFMVKLVVSRIK